MHEYKETLRSSGKEESYKVLFLGTCSAESVMENMPQSMKTAHVLFESYLHHDIPDVNYEEYDFVVIFITLRHIFFKAAVPIEGIQPSELAWTRLVTEDGARQYIDNCGNLIHQVMDKFQDLTSKSSLLFVSFIEPSTNYNGILVDNFSMTNPVMLVRELNRKISDKTKEMSNAYYVDINDVLSAGGRIKIQDDSFTHMAHASYMPVGTNPLDDMRIQPAYSPGDLYDVQTGWREILPAIGRRMIDAMDIIRQVDPIKLLIVDLDDTLWRGIAADDDKPHWEYVEGWPLGMVEALLVFKKRGGLLAICSANDEPTARKRFLEIFGSNISMDDFVSVRINYNSKNENISEILDEVNILPQNTLFIDDNPREIEAVKHVFPEMRTLSSSHLEWRSLILTSPVMQVARITTESVNRTRATQAKINRDVGMRSLDREEWLQSLELRQRNIVIQSSEHENFGRAFELINKTNQFNTTGKRWSHSDMSALFDDGGYLVAAFLRDKTVNNGLISVAIVSGNEIVQTVLSCRVFRLGAEIALGHTVIALILKDHPQAVARMVDTGRNMTCHDYYERLGMKLSQDIFTTSDVPAYPAWIKDEGEPSVRPDLAETGETSEPPKRKGMFRWFRGR
ncbi:HAD-IIIC family phosphatase [Gluconacetobacter entanii]|nr:HAD-IIIC family phosphatase [Gluconacetobacter entanii]MCW4594851.1 HAD-IIIC family phosphatase [Gluconacetobacter entanii]NPC89620.1 HAD-IIIC family phosphatase [Gluconacetobacter entanii]